MLALDHDLTAKARIRDAAMELFADQGVALTSLRSVAKAAGVSPGLIVHHFGSKDGLCRAVDEAVVRRIELTVQEVPLEGGTAEVLAGRAKAVATLLSGQPVLCNYMARALSEGTEAGAQLFHRLFESARRDEALVEAGVIREDTDPFWRAVQQLIVVVGPLILRKPIERELGGPLLDGDNLERWMSATADLLRSGIYN